MYRIILANLTALVFLACSACLPLGNEISDLPANLESVEALLNPTSISGSLVLTDTPSPQNTVSPSIIITGTPFVDLNDEKCLKAVPGVPLDVSIPDGTRVELGEIFSKTWRIINAGSCSWNQNYSVVWFSGDRFGASFSQNFYHEIKPGESIEISLDMIAPVKSGIYQGNWKLMAPDGRMFGIGPGGNAPFWVRVEVVAIATETSAPLPSSTPTPIVYSEGAMKLTLGSKMNLDNGDLNLAGNNDLELVNNEQGELSLSIFNSARVSYFGPRMPSITECMSMNQGDTFVVISEDKEEGYLCYRTNQGLPGYIRLKNINLVEGALGITFRTWFIP